LHGSADPTRPRLALRRGADLARQLLFGRDQVKGVVALARDYIAEELGQPERFVEVFDEQRFTGRPGRTLGEEHELLTGTRRRVDGPAWRVSLPAGRVAGAEPLVLTRDGRALCESGFDESQVLAHPLIGERLPRAQHVRGRLLILTGPWWTSWFHWLLDLLPRAALLPLDDGQDEVLVPARLNRAQEESLELAGVPQERRRPYSGRHIAADELVFPSIPATGNPPRWALHWLRERLAPVPRRHDRRLYVSRADTDTRRVVNEPELTALLRERGFETLIASDLGLRRQLEAFAEAEVVLAPHGGGLANLCATTSATVIELHRDDEMVRRCFFNQANSQRLDYWYLLCAPAGRADMQVDLQLLERTMDAVGVT
jgi:Glycosyltransferase 61